MLILASKLLNTPIMGLQTGSQLALTGNAIINPENMEDRIVVRFRVGGIYQNMYESVYVNDRRIIHKKRQILAPGEMESLEIKKSDLKDAKSILITLEEG